MPLVSSHDGAIIRGGRCSLNNLRSVKTEMVKCDECGGKDGEDGDVFSG